MKSVGEALPNEYARARELYRQYVVLGSVMEFGAAVIKQVLHRAEEAAISGDPVQIVRAFAELHECE